MAKAKDDEQTQFALLALMTEVEDLQRASEAVVKQVRHLAKQHGIAPPVA